MAIPTVITESWVRDQLKTVLDPELNIDVVSLGLIYDVNVRDVQDAEGKHQHVHILMTLTTPGCPLAGVIESMIRDLLRPIPGFDADQHLSIEITFDPPWVVEMMSDEAKAELGFDT